MINDGSSFYQDGNTPMEIAALGGRLAMKILLQDAVKVRSQASCSDPAAPASKGGLQDAGVDKNTEAEVREGKGDDCCTHNRSILSVLSMLPSDRASRQLSQM